MSEESTRLETSSEGSGAEGAVGDAEPLASEGTSDPPGLTAEEAAAPPGLTAEDANARPGLTAEDAQRLDPSIRLALATWPQIDPAVEGIVTHIGDAERLLDAEMKRSLDHVGLTKEEFKVLIALHPGPLSHGTLCRRLEVSTGAMTNRLDKLERANLVVRERDPSDRRGVLLALTDGGRERLNAYVDLGAHRERELLGGLTAADKRRLNALLVKLLDSLRSELG